MVFIAKHLQDKKPQKRYVPSVKETSKTENRVKKDTATPNKKKKDKLTESKMNTSEKIALAKEILGSDNGQNNLKVLKKDKGLIERTEKSKIILTEDNKELLND